MIDFGTFSFYTHAKKAVMDFMRIAILSYTDFRGYPLNDKFAKDRLLRKVLRFHKEVTYETEMVNIIKKIVKPGWICADVGAHHGIITSQLAKLVGNDGLVIAFEALPENAKICGINMAIKGFKNNVKIENMAITDREKSDIWLFNGRNSSSYEWNIVGHDVAGHETVPRFKIRTGSLDNYFRNYNQLDFLKIDIEGAAHLALAGMRQRILSSIKPTLIIEFHNDLEWIAGKAELLNANYELYDIHRNCSAKDSDHFVYHCLATPYVYEI